MRNEALHIALRDFALEAAALLTADLDSGAELQFDLEDEGSRRGPALYRYRPLIEVFIGERWPRLRGLPSFDPAALALGAGAGRLMRAHGLRGEDAGQALRAMLERLYEDSTSFRFPEERFKRVIAEVEQTLDQGTAQAMIVAALPGLALEADRIELGDGLSIEHGADVGAPPEAAWAEDGETPRAVVVLRFELDDDDELPVAEARRRFRALVEGLRLYSAGAVTLPGVGFAREAEGRWQPLELEGAASRCCWPRTRRPPSWPASWRLSRAPPGAPGWPGRSVASTWAARVRSRPRRSRITCWRCGRYSTWTATACRCGLPPCAPRTSSAAGCSGAWSARSPWSVR